MFRDIINPVIIEEVKPIQLRITIQPGDTAVFKYDQDGNPNDVKMNPDVDDICKRKLCRFQKNLHRRGTVLGMSCDAYSEVDNEVS